MGWVVSYHWYVMFAYRNRYGTIIEAEAEAYTKACQLLQFNSIEPPLDVYTIRKMCTLYIHF